MRLDTQEILNIACYRTTPGIWVVTEILTDSDGNELWEDRFRLGGSNSPKSILEYLNNLVDILCSRGFVSQMVAFTPMTDDLDIFWRVKKLYKALGINQP